jgi:Zn-finger nucleic acid-binding protein
VNQDTDVGAETAKKPSARVPRVNCRVCGIPFATEKQVRRVHEKLHFSEELAATCPRCRGVEFRGAMEKVLSSKE